jgi:hypothetical protein
MSKSIVDGSLGKGLHTISRIVLCVLLGVAVEHASAAIYYVSPTGNDSSTGQSIASPWKTIARVNREPIRPGDRVLLQKGGVWHEELEIRGGVAGSPIFYGAYGTSAQKPILDGALPVSTWEPVSEGTYRTAYVARAGKIFREAAPLAEEIPITATGSAASTTPAEGTFSQVDGYLYIHLAGGLNPNSLPLEVSAASRRYAVQSRGQSHFIIDGLALVRTYNSAMISAPRTAAVGSTEVQGSDIVIENCYVANFGTPYERHANDNPGDAGEGGIYIAGRHDQSAIGEQGIPGIVVKDNVVGRFDSKGVLDYDRAGIYLRNTISGIVSGNTVRTVTAMGIRIADNYNNHFNEKTIVAENDLANNQGNIAIAGCEGCVVRHNRIHDSAGYGIGVGTGFFAPSEHTELRSNLIQRLLPSQDGTLYNGVDCNAGSSNGIATENRIEAVANYSFTLEADGNRPCAGWTLDRNTFDARLNGMWNRKPAGRRGALYVQALSLNGLILRANVIQAFGDYPKGVAFGSRSASDVTKDIEPSTVPQSTVTASAAR